MLKFQEDKNLELELVVGNYYTNKIGIQHLFQLIFDDDVYYYINCKTGRQAGAKCGSLEELKEHTRDDMIPFYGTITISKD